jgi:hypothetical protein
VSDTPRTDAEEKSASYFTGVEIRQAWNLARQLERDANRYAARRWKIYHERQRLQVGGPRPSFDEFVKEYNAACDKDVEKFEAERREYGPIPQVENAVENPAVSPDAPVGTGSGPVSGVTGRRDGHHIDDIDRLLCLFENSSALYWQNDQNERVSERRLLEMFDAMNKRRHELVVGINALRAKCNRDPRQSQPKCHSCGGWVKVEEGGICLPCHTEDSSTPQSHHSGDKP